MSGPNSTVLIEGVPGEGAEPCPAAAGGRHEPSAGQGCSHSQDGGRGRMLEERLSIQFPGPKQRR